MPTYTNPGLISFDGPIIRNTDVVNSSTWVEFPYDVLELYGTRGRVPVRVTFDQIPYRGSMVRMGGERHLLLILKEISAQLGKSRGEQVHVTVELDEDVRTITLPDDAQKELSSRPAALAVWNRLSYSHQREYLQWIEGAKRPETRVRRIEGMCAKLTGDTPTIT